MGNLKSLALLALLFSFSLAVFADTSTDATHAKDEVKPSTEATDAIEPQQRAGCRYGCCGSFAFGRCSACCSRPQTTEVEANNVVVEPQQGQKGWYGGGYGGGCRFGCCGGWWYGRCRYCCASQAEANEVEKTVDPQKAVEAEAVEANVVDPQQGGRGGGGGRGGCRYGCCAGRSAGRCIYCCASQAEANKVLKTVEPQQAEANVVDPQQGMGGVIGGGRGGCRYGCCGGWWRGRCRYCCASQAEANEVVETVEPQQGWYGGCRFGCCGGWWRGQCRYCCRSQAEASEVVDTVEKKMATEGEKKKEEAKP